jgi:hypothetical protein
MQMNRCTQCNKELISYNKQRKKFYSHKTKTGLCRKCSAKDNYKKRGMFTHNNGKLWSANEISILINEYPNKDSYELSSILKRPVGSIMHKANRLNIHKSKEFWNTNPLVTSKMFSSTNNPMQNQVSKDKARLKVQQGWKEGRIKLSGVALRSHLGFNKKENHPNWLGGKSFEPYDPKFDEFFCKAIRLRDNFVCMVCNQENSIELSEIGQSLCVHHVDYNKKNTSVENCISLCNSCHCKTNYNRSSWIKFFQTLMSDRYGYDYEYN